MQSSQDLAVGHIYTRAELRTKFGIADAAINNGVFKPKGHSSIWLFVTKDKTSDRTQYRDSLNGDVLTMEGQSLGRTDHWLINHAHEGNELLLFYRGSKTEHPGAAFVFEGVFQYVRHTGSQPATFTLVRISETHEPREKFQWEHVVDAVAVLGGSATPAEVLAHLWTHLPRIGESTVRADLAALSVNSRARTSYGANAKARQTNEGHPWDRLFKVGTGRGVRFEIYDPNRHGIWEIYRDESATSNSGMSVRKVGSSNIPDLSLLTSDEALFPAFNADDVGDARHRVLASIARRRGQSAFRNSLIEAYEGSCAITGCKIDAILEAAHVHPYRGDHTNVVTNGLLLRADIHTLFDLGLIVVKAKTNLVQVAPHLKGTEYWKLQGKRLRAPRHPSQAVSASALDWHLSQFPWWQRTVYMNSAVD